MGWTLHSAPGPDAGLILVVPDDCARIEQREAVRCHLAVVRLPTAAGLGRPDAELHLVAEIQVGGPALTELGVMEEELLGSVGAIDEAEVLAKAADPPPLNRQMVAGAAMVPTGVSASPSSPPA